MAVTVCGKSSLLVHGDGLTGFSGQLGRVVLELVNGDPGRLGLGRGFPAGNDANCSERESEGDHEATLSMR